jgi:hypothetical protein
MRPRCGATCNQRDVDSRLVHGLSVKFERTGQMAAFGTRWPPECLPDASSDWRFLAEPGPLANAGDRRPHVVAELP